MPKPRDIGRRPRLFKSKRERQFLMAMRRSSATDSENGEDFSPACLGNQHHMCNGYVPTDWTTGERDPKREACICFCHASTLIE